MATKSENFLEGGKKQYFRTKEKILQKIGKSRGYNDAEYENLWKRAQDHFHLLDNVKKFVEGYIRALTSCCVAECKLTEDIALCFEPRHSMYEASLRNKDSIAFLDLARAEYDRVIKDDFLSVLADYVRQSGTLIRRHNERNRRKIDMDRYKHDYQVGMDKGDHAKAQQNKRKYGGMKIAFEALTAEMIHDIPVFINDKEEFFAPVFARFIHAQIAFYKRANELYRELLPCFQHLDRLAIHDHQHVITDDEHTVAFEAIDLKSMPDKAELAAERSNYRSVGGVPSTTGYMSHYGHAAPGTNAATYKPSQQPLSNDPHAMSRGSASYPPPQQQQQQQGLQPPPPQNYSPHQQQQQHMYPPQQQGLQPPPPQNYGYDNNGLPSYNQPPVQYHDQRVASWGPQAGAKSPAPVKAPHQQQQFQLPPQNQGQQGQQPPQGGAPKQFKKGPKKGIKKAPSKQQNRVMPPAPGASTCTALYPFEGQDQSELSFQAGDQITLIRSEPGQDWWEGELNGVRGLVPANYVQKN